ncbi:MAG: hypothetical protein LKJ44_05675 [Bifidobacteriaceae bacterium]|jgi:VIT1/CCC1 family predicted Fe2+/Mn2+ transporter|nr:hypothetical protein [Bifidobacteriaceae bacterium]MCI1979185.1 hypothetical protein [Bifidobacteriaceae bacterium]
MTEKNTDSSMDETKRLQQADSSAAEETVPLKSAFDYFDPETKPIAQSPAPQEPLTAAEQRQRKAAWKQQQRAAKEYQKEAARNGYPGGYATPNTPYYGYPAGNVGASGTRGGAGTGPAASGGNWNGWYQQPYPRPIYRKGPNVAAIVWGGITLLAGVIALFWLWMPGLLSDASLWAVILSICFAVIGLSLVIGAIVTSLSGIRKKKSTSTTGDYDTSK